MGGPAPAFRRSGASIQTIRLTNPFGEVMDKDKKRRPPGGVRLLQLWARVLLDTLSLVERQIAEFEAEAICLKRLGRELAARIRAGELHDQWPAVEEFNAFNKVVDAECRRILRRLAAKAQGAEVKVVVVRMPVFVRPEPSRN